MFDGKSNFTREIGNGNVPLDHINSAYRSIFQDIVSLDEDARRAIFKIFSYASIFYFNEHDND
jgi:hypothetical protein